MWYGTIMIITIEEKKEGNWKANLLNNSILTMRGLNQTPVSYYKNKLHAILIKNIKLKNYYFRLK
jgi:hypothetical protein